MASLLDKVKNTNFNYLGGKGAKYKHDPFNVIVKKQDDNIYFFFNQSTIIIPMSRLAYYVTKESENDLKTTLRELKQQNEHLKRSYSELSGQVMLEAVLINNVSETLANEVIETLKAKEKEVYGTQA